MYVYFEHRIHIHKNSLTRTRDYGILWLRESGLEVNSKPRENGRRKARGPKGGVPPMAASCQMSAFPLLFLGGSRHLQAAWQTNCRLPFLIRGMPRKEYLAS